MRNLYFVTIICFVEIVSQVSCNEYEIPHIQSSPILSLLKKQFEDNLSAHMKTVLDIYQPFVDTLEKKGCHLIEVSSLYFDEEEDVEYSEMPDQKINHGPVMEQVYNGRVDACTNFSETVVAMQSLALYSFRLGYSYKKFSTHWATNVTHCLNSGNNFPDSTICFVRSVNQYGSKLGILNQKLLDLLLNEETLRKKVITYYQACYGQDTSNWYKIAKTYASTYCNEKIGDKNLN